MKIGIHKFKIKYFLVQIYETFKLFKFASVRKEKDHLGQQTYMTYNVQQTQT